MTLPIEVGDENELRQLTEQNIRLGGRVRSCIRKEQVTREIINDLADALNALEEDVCRRDPSWKTNLSQQ